MKQYPDVVVQDQRGLLWEGTIVTPFSIEEWCSRLHYKVVQSSGFLPATGGVTSLRPKQVPQRKVSGVHQMAQGIKNLMSHLHPHKKHGSD